MFRELDIVRLGVAVPGCQAAPGALGSIVSVLHAPNIAYEVEFVDEAGCTVDVCTLKPNQIIPVREPND